MPQDYDVTRQVWESKVPIEFSVASNEITTSETVKPFYAMVQRVSYFPLACERALKYFSSVLGEAESFDDVWLEYNGYPLKWHYPVGVLYDLYKTDDALPWQITVHLKNFPDEDIIRCNSREAMESIFIQSLKEADQLKHKAEIMNSMQKRDHKQLWSGLSNDRYDQFWSVNKKLMEPPQSLQTFLHLPIRLYQLDKSFRQLLIKPFTDIDSCQRTTVRDVLVQFGITDYSPDNHGDNNSGDCWRLLSHGIDIPPDTPAVWLCENLCYPDNFAHLCYVSKQL